MLCVSVIMPLYNKEQFVERAIRSVLAQTVDDFEVIVVDDGSTDKGPDIARAIKDDRIRVVDQDNAGVSAARNRGIEEAQADLIAFLDADDEWEKDFLETILDLRNKFPSCGVYSTNYYFAGSHHRRQAFIKGLPAGFKEGILQDYFVIAAKSDPPLWTSAVTVTKTAIRSVDGFPLGISSGEDLLTWAGIAARFDIAYTTKAKAFFWEPVSTSDRPGRVPQTPDIVGRELQQLKHRGEPSRLKGMDKYLSLWHRMRANIYIRLGNNAAARKELLIAMKYANNPRLLILLGISLSPGKYAAKVLEAIKRMRTKRATR